MQGSTKLRENLERLLDRAEGVGDDADAEGAWASETRRFIDAFLGPQPSPPNVHSAGFYDFIFAESHSERVAILRAILLSSPAGEATEKMAAMSHHRPTRKPRNRTADIFLSHVEEDEAVALAVADALHAVGYSVWCYERETVPGLSYLVQTGEAIKSCRAFLLLISVHSLLSRQIEIEIERAHEESKPFIPLRLGVSHLEFQARRPIWRQAIGTTASVELRRDAIDESIDQIVDGLSGIGIPPSHDDSGSHCTPLSAVANELEKGTEGGTTATTVERRQEVVDQLRIFLRELRRAFYDAQTGKSFESSEQYLRRWKSRVIRFLDANLSFDEAVSCSRIHTALSAGNNLEHLESSFEGHKGYLEGLIGEIEGDRGFPINATATASGKALPSVGSFTYKGP